LDACSKPLTSALPTSASGSFSWPTPRAEDSESSGAHRGVPDTLTSAVRTWPTPCSRDGKGAFSNHTQGGRDLSEAVKEEWPTPTVAIATGGQTSRGGDRKDEMLLTGMAAASSEHADGKLNPDWVETLMGLPIGWTDGPADPETLLLFGSLREP
jgi:hypothetical protein